MPSALAYAVGLEILMGADAKREVTVLCVWCIDRLDREGEWEVRSAPQPAECLGCPVVGADVKIVVRPKKSA